MKIAILGATGRSGKPLVSQALEHGHEVMALVRNPDKLKIENEKLKAVKVDIFNSDTMVEPLKGCDCVISCLGVDVGLTTLFSATTFYSASMKAITEAMRQTGVKRLILISSWMTEDDPQAPMYLRWVVAPMIGRLLKDMAIAEKFLQESCSDLEFTSVRPPHLDEKDMRGGEFAVEEGKSFVAKGEWCLTRADLARFLLMVAEKGMHVNKMVAMTLAK